MILTAVKKPSIILPKQHLFLVSHMRSNTSLFGHLIGSSPEVSGYYEMHIGYYSWKSLIRQKLIYHSVHPQHPSTKYYFDKILHSEHKVTDDIIARNNCRFIFMLRNPERSIKSACSLYRRVEPEHEFATIEGSARYYINRVKDIEDFLSRCGEDKLLCYLDAESLISEPDLTLKGLSEWLELKEPLTQEYSKFELTGAEKVGDSSAHINAGKISEKATNYDDLSIDTALLEESQKVYQQVRAKLKSRCHCI